MRPALRYVVLAIVPFLLLSACTPPAISSRRFKILVSTEAFYRLTGAQLASAGIPIDRIDPSILQLFRGDQEVAVRVRGEGAQLVLDFYGQASESPYSAWNVYWLTWGSEIGKRISNRPGEPPEQNRSTTAESHIRFERPTLFIPQRGEIADSWYWQALTAPISTSIPVTLPFATATQAQLSVDLFGSSQDVLKPDHHLKLALNDTMIADETWDGPGKHSIRAIVPTGVLRSESNTLQLAMPGDTRAVVDIALLSSIGITYTQKLAAQQDALSFQASKGTYRLEGFTGDAIDLFDITDPKAPIEVTAAKVAKGGLTFGTADTTERRWLAVGPAGYKPIAGLVPMQTADLAASARDADYVVITHPDFVEPLRPLVEWRSKRGRRVFVVTTSEIYDNYNFGAESPFALRAFLRDASPRYVLLVGKASYDYRNYLQAPNKNLVPTFLVDTMSLGQAASDNWFAANGETDAHPKFAIGRIPAKTRQQVTVAINKIIGYESGARGQEWRKRAIFVADDKDKSFAALADELAAQAAPEIGTEKLYLDAHKADIDAARTDLLARWNEGSLLLTYVGHGSVDTWAEGPLLSTGDIPQLRNGNRLPVMLTPTCLDGFFYHPEKDSLAEDLLFRNEGGIVAGVVPTGFSITDAQAALMRALFTELFRASAPTLGEALLRSKQELPVDAPEMREVIETFVLLGDPALDVGH